MGSEKSKIPHKKNLLKKRATSNFKPKSSNAKYNKLRQTYKLKISQKNHNSYYLRT